VNGRRSIKEVREEMTAAGVLSTSPGLRARDFAGRRGRGDPAMSSARYAHSQVMMKLLALHSRVYVKTKQTADELLSKVEAAEAEI